MFISDKLQLNSTFTVPAASAQLIITSTNFEPLLKTVTTVASEAYHDWSGEAAGARLRVNFTLKLLLSQNFCNRPLMRFISLASNIGPAAAVPAGPAPTPLDKKHTDPLYPLSDFAV